MKIDKNLDLPEAENIILAAYKKNSFYGKMTRGSISKFIQNKYGVKAADLLTDIVNKKLSHKNPVKISKVKGGYRVKTPHGIKAYKTTLKKAKAQKRVIEKVRKNPPVKYSVYISFDGPNAKIVAYRYAAFIRFLLIDVPTPQSFIKGLSGVKLLKINMISGSDFKESTSHKTIITFCGGRSRGVAESYLFHVYQKNNDHVSLMSSPKGWNKFYKHTSGSSADSVVVIAN